MADVKEGATIVIPADDSNETRALLLLQQEGLIELPEGANAKDGVTTLDIKDDHGYKITTVQADTVAAQFANSDAGSLAVINGNYALAAGLDISKALAVEDASGDAAQTYANIVAVKSGNENLPKIQALIKALKSDDVKTSSMKSTTVQLLQSSDLTNKISPEVSDIQSGSLTNSEGALLL